MTDETLPHAWTWPDDDGCDHMVVEGTKLEPGEGRKPAFQALCGQSIPIRELLLRQRFTGCKACLDRLSELLAARLDGLPTPIR